MDMPHFVYPSVDDHLRFDFLTIVNYATKKIYVQIFVWTDILNSLCYPRSRITGSYGNSVFNFYRNCYTASYSDSTVLLSHHQCMTVAISSHPCQHLLFFSAFYSYSHPMVSDMLSSFGLYLHCIMPNDTDHLLMFLLASSFLKIFFKFKFMYFNWRLITLQYCILLPYINMNLPWVYTCFLYWTPSLLPPHTIPLGHPSAPAPSILYPASKLDWRFISYMILYMFQCHSPKSFHPLSLPQSPKYCSILLGSSLSSLEIYLNPLSLLKLGCLFIEFHVFFSISRILELYQIHNLKIFLPFCDFPWWCPLMHRSF